MGTAYPSGAPECIPSCRVVSVVQSFFLCVVFVDRFCLFLLLAIAFCPLLSSYPLYREAMLIIKFSFGMAHSFNFNGSDCRLANNISATHVSRREQI